MSAFHDLLGPLSIDTLLEAHQSQSHLAWQTSGPVFDLLCSAFSAENFQELVLRSQQTSAWFRSREGKPEVLNLAPKDALSLHRSGMTLYGTLAAGDFPGLAPAFEAGHALCEAFNIPPDSFRLSYFASCSGGRTLPHFDSSNGLTLHLSGKKRWGLAKNTHVQNPTNSHYLGAPSSPQLRTVAAGPMPSLLSHEPTLVDLTPGTALFVPRGTWHETWTDEDSISIDFNFAATALWKDLLSGACERLLARAPEARAPAGEHSDREALTASLSVLKQRIARLQSSDFFPPDAPRPPLARLRWNPLATSFIETIDDTFARVIFEYSQFSEEGTQIKLKLPWLDVLRELEAGASLSSPELEARGFRPAEVKAVLDALWLEGILREAPAAP